MQAIRWRALVYRTPLNFLGPVGGKRILVCGVGAEAVGFALAGADVYGFDASRTQVEAVKDLARQLGLRDQTHLQTAEMEELAYPDNFFDLAFGKTIQKDSDLEIGTRELARVMKRGGRAAFMISAGDAIEEPVRRAFGSAVLGECWIGVEKGPADD
jgi:ubiquinone/menaquinone biosynthesis C-methylase UbiE